MGDYGKGMLAVGRTQMNLQVQQQMLQSAKQARSSGANDVESQQRIQKAAADFEGLLLQQMFKSMWNTVERAEGSLSASREESLYQDMLQQELAKEITASGGIGLQEILVKEITRLENK